MNLNRLSRMAVACGAGLALASGCNQYPDVFLDDLPQSAMVTTTSARAASEATVPPIERTRGYESYPIEPQDGTVAHAPLWLEDPFEMAGSEDEQFAVTWEELLYFPYGMFRFSLSLVLMPVSMVVDPPFAVVCSDGMERRGRLSGALEPFDAERCIGLTTPPDVHKTWSFEDTYQAMRSRQTAADAGSDSSPKTEPESPS